MNNSFKRVNGAAAPVRGMYENRYTSARYDLLAIVILTVVNIALIFGGESYFLFSAYIPYFIAYMGAYLTGMLPPSHYEDVVSADFFGTEVLVVMLVIAAVFVVMYLLAWIFSKKHVGWMIFALVFFSLDTLFLLTLFSADIILDIVIHGALIVILAMGIHAHFKLKSLPADEILMDAPEGFAQDQGFAQGEEAPVLADSPVIRYADNTVKSRVFHEVDVDGHKVCYRKVKKVYELIIDGRVYSELSMTIDTVHNLSATFGGHYIEAGYYNNASYVNVDGKNVARKIRWY